MITILVTICKKVVVVKGELTINFFGVYVFLTFINFQKSYDQNQRFSQLYPVVKSACLNYIPFINESYS